MLKDQSSTQQDSNNQLLAKSQWMQAILALLVFLCSLLGFAVNQYMRLERIEYKLNESLVNFQNSIQILTLQRDELSEVLHGIQVNQRELAVALRELNKRVERLENIR